MTRVECPICLRLTEANPCECGYDFDTCDRTVAAERAEQICARSTRRVWTGVALLATLPLTLSLASVGPALQILCALAAPFQLFYGIGHTARGLEWRRAAQRRLLRATQPAALPAARLIER